MTSRPEIRNSKARIVIAGAGPAGTGLAIRLAKRDFEVILVEREKFPRQKLCGEFISPECLEHFRRLEVLDEMLSVGGDQISETVFYAPNGQSIRIPSSWFGTSQNALSISRAEMDLRLLRKARSVGVKVLEETSVIGVLFEGERVSGVKIKSKTGQTSEIPADLTIDATGRANVLAKLVDKSKKRKTPDFRPPNRLVGFKTHLRNVCLEKGRCEIYFFPCGYGGLSLIEDNRANHCFLIKSELVRQIGPADLLEKVVFRNRRAFAAMKNADPLFDWLAVSIDGFGIKNLNPARNLYTVGDAAAFIDPFTGSGMLMALESGELLARIILQKNISDEEITKLYAGSYQKKFQKRLRVCQLMRRAAFVPNLAQAVISILSLSQTMQKIVVQATRENGMF